MIGQRQRHRDLAVILLAELTAILPGHPDRAPPLLGKARVVDDPGLDRPAALDRRQHQLAELGQHRRVRPRCVADKMKQRLVLAATCAGAVTAAIGSPLLRSIGINSPRCGNGAAHDNGLPGMGGCPSQ